MRILMTISRGSSPLARGLPGCGSRRTFATRIIPARAGFTRGGHLQVISTSDHPRSRGVYSSSWCRPSRSWGSSPLARGLRRRAVAADRARRIIPARAGFTPPSYAGAWTTGDHPRSRGVYDRVRLVRLRRPGSSPLARGLPECGPPGGPKPGIIPARAGFTSPSRPRRRLWWDHPRSRGVYTCGSLESQRTRTLPDPCCLHCRPRVRSAELR